MNNYYHYKDKRFENSLLVQGLALSGKLHNFIMRTPKLSRCTSEVDIIILERQWTDIMQELMNLGNEYLLQNFNLSLILEG